MRQVLIESYNRATDNQRADGLFWYKEVRELAMDLSIIYGQPLYVVAGVIAALSPRNKFARNIQDTRSVLELGEAATVATFGANKRKALRIIQEARSQEDVIGILKGNKVVSFFCNIFYRHDDEVTVDVWMLRLLGITGGITEKKYREAADAVRSAAYELGVQPKQLQAVTWVEVRGEAF
jgi:hypothetical protein